MNKLIIYIIIIIIIGIILRIISKKIIKNGDKYNLNDSGFTVIKSILNENDIIILNKFWENKKYLEIKNYIQNNNNVKNLILKKLNNYIFQDYIFLIEKSKIHTCHRDANSKIYNDKQKYPSYTILFYIDQMDYCLDVIANSHKPTMDLYLTDTTKSIICDKGDVVIFDSTLVHSGSFNDKPNNKRIQMKLTHIDDINTLSFYQNYNKILDKENTNLPIFSKMQKYLSCQFPFVSDLTNDEVKATTNKDNNFFRKIFSKLFYSDENFYELPTVI